MAQWWSLLVTNFITTFVSLALSIACTSIVAVNGDTGELVSNKHGCDGQDTLILPKHYLITASVVCIAEFIIACGVCLAHRIIQNKTGVTLCIIIATDLILAAWNVVWDIIGSCILWNLTSDCLKSTMGQMIYAYLIMTTLLIGSLITSIVAEFISYRQTCAEREIHGVNNEYVQALFGDNNGDAYVPVPLWTQRQEHDLADLDTTNIETTSIGSSVINK